MWRMFHEWSIRFFQSQPPPPGPSRGGVIVNSTSALLCTNNDWAREASNPPPILKGKYGFGGKATCLCFISLLVNAD